MGMRDYATSIVAAVFGVAAIAAVVSAQQTVDAQPVPMDQEPRHRVVFTDEGFRVLEVHVPAGDTTLEHQHDRDLLTVNIENGPTRTRDRGADWGGIRPRSIGGVNVNEYTGKASAHVVQSVGDRAYRLTGVENRKDGAWTTLAPIAGEYLTVVAESRAFRAYELRLPASTSVTHVHPVPVVVTLVDGAVVVSAAERRSLTSPGQWSVVPAGRAHVVEAIGRGVRVVEVEAR